VDFFCPDAKLVVELDGGQHLEQVPYDWERTRMLEATGCRVLRFWNHEVLSQLEDVLEAIHRVLDCQ
jgi:very-short-patch-repair endonuclease